MSADIEKTPIPAPKILNAVKSLEGMLSKLAVDGLLDNLAENGVDLNDQNRSYLFRDLQIVLDQTFASGTGLLMQKIKEDLAQR